MLISTVFVVSLEDKLRKESSRKKLKCLSVKKFCVILIIVYQSTMSETKQSKKNSEEVENEDQLPKGPVENAWSLSIPSFSKDDMKHNLQEESRFEIAFPKYREAYIKECWPVAQKVFNEHGIKAELDLLEGIMSVATTRKTWDPYIILKARDLIKLLGRSVPFEQAVKVLKDDVTCEIVKIKNLVRNKDRLVKRRQRLIGSNGTALKTLELLTDCYVLVQGCTVSAIGPHKGVQQVTRVVLQTMKNIHPINLLKSLMVKRTLSMDPDKKNEDWGKYIPSYNSTNVQRKKPKKFRPKKPYTPFPPERLEQKEDEAIDSGRYFIEKEEWAKQKRKGRNDEKRQKAEEKRKEKRAKPFEVPDEPSFSSHSIPSTSGTDVDVKKLKKKIQAKYK